MRHCVIQKIIQVIPIESSLSTATGFGCFIFCKKAETTDATQFVD